MLRWKKEKTMSVSRCVGSGFALISVLGLGGCSDPSSPVPQGAFTVTFGNPVGSSVTCPATQPSLLQVGAVGPAQHATISDGDDDATIECSVVKKGQGFVASGSISKGLTRFRLVPTAVGEGNSNQGRIFVAGANTAGKSYGASAESPCNFQLIEGEEGKIWLSFECPLIETGSSENEKCSLVNGYLFFENCES